jgi:hypothetical protein
MADQVIGQPDVQSLALAEPTRHVRNRWIIGLTLASLGMWMANQTPLQVMLALQLQDIAASAQDRCARGGDRGRGHRFRPGLVSGYITLAVLMVVLALPFVLFTPDYPLSPKYREPFSWRRVASSYWLSPRAYPDFGWAWLTRFLASLSRATAATSRSTRR